MGTLSEEIRTLETAIATAAQIFTRNTKIVVSGFDLTLVSGTSPVPRESNFGYIVAVKVKE